MHKGAHFPSTLGACISAHNSRDSLQKKKKNSIVNLYQDFKTSILPSVRGCSFTSPSYHHWHFPNEALWFHPLCPSASSVPCGNSYRHTYPPLTPWIALPEAHCPDGGRIWRSGPHAIAPVQSQGIAVSKPKISATLLSNCWFG